MVWPKSNEVLMCTMLEIKQCMHECQKRDLFDVDTKLMTSVGPVYKQQKRVVVTVLLTTIRVMCVVTANC
jgi:hypothetical protein